MPIAITICRTGAAVTCSTKPPHSMVVRAGLGLQRILKHEYGDIYVAGSGVTDPASTVMKLRNPALSKYTPYEVLQCLRQQFKSYIDGQNPFNHELQSKEPSIHIFCSRCARIN